MLRTTSKKPTSASIDSLDEFLAENQVWLLNLVDRILIKSPGTRILVTRPHIQDGIRRCLSGRVTAHITLKMGSVIRYLCRRLDEAVTLDSIDNS